VRVLVVEDADRLREIMLRRLREQGYAAVDLRIEDDGAAQLR
jgi:DNA-binding response OmpR family regulator